MIFGSVSLVDFFFILTFHHKVFGLLLCLLRQYLQGQMAKLLLFIPAKSIRLFTHLLNTCQKPPPHLVSIKSILIIKVFLFWKKASILKFTVLLCNSCFTCLLHCVGGGKKPRHSEQNVKSREIFRQQ